MAQGARSRGSARRRLVGAVLAAGTIAGFSLGGCAFGTEDFTAPAGSGGATPPVVDGDVPADSGPHITKVDSSDDAPAKPDALHPVPDADPGEDSAVADTSVPDVKGASDTGGPDTTPHPVDSGLPDTSHGATCDGLNEWYAGTTDAKVKHFGEEYTCKVAGWCSESTSNAVAAYEPGKGWAWTDAWDDSGACPP